VWYDEYDSFEMGADDLTAYGGWERLFSREMPDVVAGDWIEEGVGRNEPMGGGNGIGGGVLRESSGQHAQARGTREARGEKRGESERGEGEARRGNSRVAVVPGQQKLWVNGLIRQGCAFQRSKVVEG
jgi:hypothetical protein